MKKSFFLAALVVLAFAACDPDQSELVLEGSNVKMATLTGKVTYNPGGKVAQMIPADSVEVRVLVKNAHYSKGADGDQQFGPVVTDASGMYSIQIPVGQVALAAANVEVQVVPFIADYTDPNTGVKQKVYYTSDKLNPDAPLKAGDVQRKDIEMKPELAVFKDYTSTVKISGVVTVDAGYQPVELGYEKAVMPYANKELRISGEYTVGSDKKSVDFQKVTTNEKGEYSFEVPAGSKGAKVTISTVRFDGEYTEGPDKNYKTIPVFYKVATKDVNFKDSDVEQRNQDFTVSGYDKADDLEKGYKINKISAKVFAWGEVKDDEENIYKKDSLFLDFDVKVTLTSSKFDAANPTSALKGNALVYKVTPAANGAIVLNDVMVYNAWEGYDIDVKIVAEDKLTQFTHHYKEYSKFDKEAYAKKSWAEWHIDGDAANDLIGSFWTGCWGAVEREQKLEGYYTMISPSGASFVIPEAELKYYHEYASKTTLALQFEPRYPEKIMGMWSNKDYNTLNPYDADSDSYPKYVIKSTDEVKDKNDVNICTSTSDSKVLSKNKYQTEGIEDNSGIYAYWKARFSSLN